MHDAVAAKNSQCNHRNKFDDLTLAGDDQLKKLILYLGTYGRCLARRKNHAGCRCFLNMFVGNGDFRGGPKGAQAPLLNF